MAADTNAAMERLDSGLSEVGIVKGCITKQIVSLFVMIPQYMWDIPFCVHSGFTLIFSHRLTVIQNKHTEKCNLVFMAVCFD